MIKRDEIKEIEKLFISSSNVITLEGVVI